MKRNIVSLIVIAMLSAFSVTSIAQENKERGDTDYTNNESKGKEKRDKNVNTSKQTPVKIIEYLPGTWVIENVYRGKDGVTNKDTLANNEVIEFNREGRYVSYTGKEKIDSGAYRINEQHAILYMASEGDQEKPMEWNVWFGDDGTMTMRMKGSGKADKDFSYVYRKNGTETSSNRKED